MRNLALITLILLFLMLFTTITKIFSGNVCKSGFIEMAPKKELNTLFSNFFNPLNCYCVHIHQGRPDHCHEQNNSSTSSFQHLLNNHSMTSARPYENDHELLELHNTSEVTLGYFLITQ